MSGCKDGNASGNGTPLTFEFAGDDCAEQIIRVGSRVILPCPIREQDICVQNLGNVRIDLTVNGRALAWDPATCTWGLAPTVCEQLAAMPSKLTEDMGALIGLDKDGECAQFPPPDLCAMLKLLPVLSRAARAGEYVLGLDATGACVLFAVGSQKAVDDVDLVPRPVGKPFPVNTAGNDTPCAGTTSWVLIAGSEHNVTVTPSVSPDGQFTATAIDCGVGAVARDDTDPFERAAGEQFTLNIATNDTGCADGVWSFEYELYCDGKPTGSKATASGFVECSGGPLAVNDQDFVARPIGVAFPKQVNTNDIPCPGVATTYVLRAGSTLNAQVTPATSSDGVFYVTPIDCAVVADAIDDVVTGDRSSGVPFTWNVSTNDTLCQPGVWSFEYEIYCGGAPSGAVAIVSGVVDCGLPVAIDDTITPAIPTGSATSVAPRSNDVLCPHGTTTWVLTGTPSNVTVTPTISSSGSFNVTPTAGACSSVAVAVNDTVLGVITTASAVDDATGAHPANVAFVYDVGANDNFIRPLQPGVAVTYDVAANDTPCGEPAWSFTYEMFCNGKATGVTATVAGTVAC